eukprot:CAMPEP_0114348764 /NCGR_PEP_ID=MMETSP0101-20121206/14973_1 /TAXON_ID=38822 ORGANISM="Pteridomonas danica, Strain PT" /NCGR_SAMPLE_ID=MMETSP0101 /ASSEMBLY_ACC=CAM_ASM_000211 /LENGTH=287 /DNA_ID=CAMNT_0001486893 /DNA_START=53 /DNA_END=916 /DNA_ORIENTATION=-
MAAINNSSENKPEIKIESNWGSLCDGSPSTKLSNFDSTDRELPKNAFMLQDLFTISECESLIQASENEGGFGYTNYRKEYRGNLRLITTDKSMTEVMWNRIKPFVPETLTIDGEEWHSSGLNECWRISKYHPGDQFGTHYDASFARSNDEQSIYTVNAYMNGEFTGGKTRFFDKLKNGNEIAAIKGTSGQCLIFMQPPGDRLAHDGEKVESGVKYLFRSDVMYTRTSSSSNSNKNIEKNEKDDETLGLEMLKQARDLEADSKLPEAFEIYSRLKMFYPEVAAKNNVL